MKEWRGLWFPDNETHLIEWMTEVGHQRGGKPTYQYHKYEAALKFCTQRRTAVDVGANIGLWSRVMAMDFKRVEAFEPVSEFVDCWLCNVSQEHANLTSAALGADNRTVTMVNVTGNSCGDTTVDVGQGGTKLDEVAMLPLDSFGLREVDLLKIDNEGYELYVVQGAVETIKRCRPVIIVEQKAGHGKAFGISDTAAVEYLQTLGMRQLQKPISGDYFLGF